MPPRDGGDDPDDGGPNDAGPNDPGPPDDGGLKDAGPNDAGPSVPVDGGVPDGGDDGGAFVGQVASIIVSAGDLGIEVDDVIRVMFDHRGISLLGNATVALHLNGVGEELNRVLAPGSEWGRADTEIWFQLRAPLAPDEVAVFDVVIDGTSEAPHDLSPFIVAGDSFDDNTLDPSLSLSINGEETVSVVEEDGRLTVTMTEDQAEAAIIVGTNPLPANRRFLIRHRMEASRIDGVGDSPNIKTIGIVQWPQRPTFAPTNQLGENYRQRVVLSQANPELARSRIYYRDVDRILFGWDGNGFSSGDYPQWGTLPLGVDHIFEVDSDGVSFTMKVTSVGGEVLMRADPVLWSSVRLLEEPVGDDLSTGDFWFYFGEVYVTHEPESSGGPYYTADFSSDWIYQIQPSPVGSVVDFVSIP